MSNQPLVNRRRIDGLKDIGYACNLTDEILAQDLKRSQTKVKLAELAQKYRLNPQEVIKIYKLREEEQEQEFTQEDVATEVERLLSAQKFQIILAELLPPALAAPIQKLASRLNLKK